MEALRGFIPGFNSTNEEHHQKSSEENHEVHDTVQENQGGGILSFIPGMGGGEKAGDKNGVNEEQDGVTNPGYGQKQDGYGNDGTNQDPTEDNDADTRATRSGVAYNKAPSGVQKYGKDSGNQGQGTYAPNQGDQGYGEQTVDTDAGYGAGNEGGYDIPNQQGVNTGYGGGNEGGYADRDEGAYANPNQQEVNAEYDNSSANAGRGAGNEGGYDNPNQGNNEAYDNTGAGEYEGGDTAGDDTDSGLHRGLDSSDNNGIRGAPIRGPNIKGYAVSAPVGQRQGRGSDDYQDAGSPQGQVAGAHMRYGPVSGDNRDTSGRGTVSRTDGEGDSSYSNVKRNIPGGNEHVISQSSSSRVQRTSTTQM